MQPVDRVSRSWGRRLRRLFDLSILFFFSIQSFFVFVLFLSRTKLLISIMFAKVQPAAGVIEKRFLPDGPAADTYLQVFLCLIG